MTPQWYCVKDVKQYNLYRIGWIPISPSSIKQDGEIIRLWSLLLNLNGLFFGGSLQWVIELLIYMTKHKHYSN